MARPAKRVIKLENNEDVFLNEMSNFIKELNDFKVKTLTDYKEIKALMDNEGDDITTRLSCENIRNNTMKDYGYYHKTKLDALKIYASFIMNGKTSKGDEDGEKKGSLDTNDKENLTKYIAELRSKVKKD